MKKFFSLIILAFYLCNMFGIPALSEGLKTRDELYAKYNFTDEQKRFIRYITSPEGNIDTTEKIIELGLLEDCKKSLKNRYGAGEYASRLYLIAKSNPDNLSEKELKKVDKDFGNDYIIQIDDNFYNGVSKIDFSLVSPTSNVKIFDKFYFKNIKTVKKYLEIQNKYSLDDKTMYCIMIDTDKFTKNADTLQEALEDGLYEKYTKYCHDKSYAIYASGFPKRYKAVKKIETAKYLTDVQKNEAYCHRGWIIKADETYYGNLGKIENFSEVKNLEYFNKDKFPYVENLKEYNSFQNEFQLDDATMNNVWKDSKKLKKNKKLIKAALKDGTYQEFYRVKKNDKIYKSYFIKWSNNSDDDIIFKDDYKSYLYMKEHSNFEEKQIRSILRKRGEPEVAVNPFYWGDKEQKIKKTLKKQNLSDEEKYNQIIDRMDYRRPTTQEWIDDTATKAFIATMFLSVIGTIGGIMALAGYSDAGGKFIKIVW